jgi:predicted phosphoadenosine phosphosulfate sulfurtransferase
MELLKLNLAPSYKSICMAILKNDHSLKSLGFEGKKSVWYNVLKKIELQNRNKNMNENIKIDNQLYLFNQGDMFENVG